jgi:hypothetical protein
VAGSIVEHPCSMIEHSYAVVGADRRDFAALAAGTALAPAPAP